MLLRTAMLPDPLVVSPSTSLLDFIGRVLESNQTTAVVVDDQRLSGIVSVQDIFRKILPEYVGEKLAFAIREGFFEEKFSKFASISVSEIMSTEIDVLQPNDKVIMAVALFVRKGHKTIPVIEGGRYVGSVTRRSVLAQVTEGRT